MLNPVTLLLVWIAALIGLSQLHWPMAAGSAVCVLLLAAGYAPRQLCRLLRRSRWLIVTVLLLFSCMTPGLPVLSWPGLTFISSEGVRLALEQLGRLILAIAMLAVLLRRLAMAELVVGLRGLVRPLCWFGLNRDLLALRLTLTLQRLEDGAGLTQPLSGALAGLAAIPADGPAAAIRLQVRGFGWRDGLLVVALAATLALLAMMSGAP